MSGPIKRANITIEELPDGRPVHTFRQSTLGELDLCAERGRLTMTGDMPRIETDAAGIGTAIHEGIEEALRDVMEGVTPSLAVAQEVAQRFFEQLQAQDNFAWKKYHSNGKIARRFIDSALELFFAEVLETIEPTHLELPFGPVVIADNDDRVIQITGTIDCVDANLGPIDWKSSGDGRKYMRGMGGSAWEIERWAIQPTVYIAALLDMGLLDDTADEWPFTFYAFHMDGKDPALNVLQVTRHRGDLQWLVDKCTSYAELIEAEAMMWPRNDNHALCSEKWCPAWDQCKGANYAVGWPKPSAPAA